MEFLSTLSLRRATPSIFLHCTTYLFLSTLSLRRATAMFRLIRSLRVYFYPRSPCGERPDGLFFIDGRNGISIHALLAESDIIKISFPFRPSIFLSTLSLRRATVSAVLSMYNLLFLSTLSLRRATAKVHKTVGHFCAYGTNFMGIASSC